MISTIALCLLCFTLQQPDASKIEAPKTDSWRAWLDCPGGELPFGIWLQRDMDKWSAFIINGKERAAVPHVEWTGAELVLDITDYDSTIRAKPSENGRRL
ncbi:MAG: hypothetical protein HYR83_06455, partial [Planctomycetes bacterium]|nr:hypothetical protein [Planctomycetota bacterium]